MELSSEEVCLNFQTELVCVVFE